MSRFAVALVAFLLTVASPPDARAQDADQVRAMNAVSDMARAQRDQADSLRRMESIQRDQARRADSARQNAERDSRSMRRFDR
ncbi:hypothetical protein [Methylobacterium sp. 88A]|uniref:hypothetical protein n=1 Tax=Methylobacterium sp. 88A TaxID=1131813 RepID=UPI000360240C|nr:hypothetical protein [Methylobacterium sp. 88A]